VTAAEIEHDTGLGAPPRAIPAGSLARTWGGFALGFLGLLGAILSLPFDPYVAWQQAQGTEMFHARWIYERIVDDPAPIDVAVIGSSRFESGLSPGILGRELSERLGRPIRVTNLSIVRPGRDFNYLEVREIFAHHPEVRLLVLSDDGALASSHPMFRETASLRDLIAAPVLVNTDYLPALFLAPYRSLANFVEHSAPGWFGVETQFRPAAYLGSDLDRTAGYLLPDGHRRNGDLHMTEAELLARARYTLSKQDRGLVARLPLPESMTLAVDRSYVAQIVADARARGVAVVFVSLPMFGPVSLKGDSRYYRTLAPDMALPALARDPSLYQDDLHLNRSGAERASRAVAPLLASLLVPNSSRRTSP
jgi:hypothetical protein